VVSRNEPAYPCRGCGSPKHFDNDCPHYPEFAGKLGAKVFSHAYIAEIERPPNIQREYDADFASMLVEHNLRPSVVSRHVHSMEYDLPHPLASFLVDKKNEVFLNWINPRGLPGAVRSVKDYRASTAKKNSELEASLPDKPLLLAEEPTPESSDRVPSSEEESDDPPLDDPDPEGNSKPKVKL
jgi:hypothetical protein